MQVSDLGFDTSTTDAIYTIDWDTTTVRMSVNGQVIRTIQLWRPLRPMQLTMSVWYVFLLQPASFPGSRRHIISVQTLAAPAHIWWLTSPPRRFNNTGRQWAVGTAWCDGPVALTGASTATAPSLPISRS